MTFTTSKERADAKDALIRALKRKPWMTAGEVAPTAKLTEASASQLLEEMTAAGLLASRGAKLPALPASGETPRVLAAISGAPWKRAQFYADEYGFDRGRVAGAVHVLLKRGLVVTARPAGRPLAHPVYARAGTPPPDGHLVDTPELMVPRRSFAVKGLWRTTPTKPRGVSRKIRPEALAVLELVQAHPWLTAGEYAKLRGRAHRYASYSTLEGLVRRGLVVKTSKDRVMHFGPAGVPVPAGHMRMAAQAPSLLRMGGRERLLAFLAEMPWQTVAGLTGRLKLSHKAVDNLVRSELLKGTIVREYTPGGMKDVAVHALPSSPPVSDDDRVRVREEGLRRLPEHYGKARSRVMEELALRPWQSTGSVAKALDVPVGVINQAITRLMEELAVERVTDGVYKYAPRGTPKPASISGVHDRVVDGKGKWCARILEVLQAEGGGMTNLMIQKACGVREKGPAAALHHACLRLEKRGCIKRGLARDTNRSPRARGRSEVQAWFYVRAWDDAASPADLVQRMEGLAVALRSRGYDIMLSVTPPASAGA